MQSSPDIRQIIKSDIQTIRPFDTIEDRHIRETTDWIDSGAQVFRIAKPATPPRHLVSYFVVLDHDHVLLVDHLKALLWLPPGGHVDVDEHPKDTVRRECREELGIEAEFLHDAPQFLTVARTVGLTAGHTDVTLWYVLQGQRDAELAFDGTEFEQVRWFHRTEIPYERTDRNLRRFLSKLDKTM